MNNKIYPTDTWIQDPKCWNSSNNDQKVSFADTTSDYPNAQQKIQSPHSSDYQCDSFCLHNLPYRPSQTHAPAQSEELFYTNSSRSLGQESDGRSESFRTTTISFPSPEHRNNFVARDESECYSARIKSVSGRLVCCEHHSQFHKKVRSITGNVSKIAAEEQCSAYHCPTVEGASLELIEKDPIDPDDVIAKFQSVTNGFYSAIGTEDEYFGTSWKIDIYHSCGNTKPGCVRKTSIDVPDDLINKCTPFAIDPFDLSNPR
ncbi:transthyretin-like family domain-containing protein [Ditylenchus destructor]|uniref:Transthyretin-like family domain-containing protein n=1 Tax=Ditylenchus destructor TaxID=166010 RepID=A0AAD4N8N3_9BILA|nr:transthyretin-like family domain-containing protein [Ditylenchus destructor]